MNLVSRLLKCFIKKSFHETSLESSLFVPDYIIKSFNQYYIYYSFQNYIASFGLEYLNKKLWYMRTRGEAFSGGVT